MSTLPAYHHKTHQQDVNNRLHCGNIYATEAFMDHITMIVLERLLQDVARIEQKVDGIARRQQQELRTMSAILDKSNAALAKITEAGAAVTASYVALADQIRKLTDDPAVLAALDEITSGAANIAAAALANTPAAATVTDPAVVAAMPAVTT